MRDPIPQLGKACKFGSGRYDVDVPRESVPREFLDRGVLIDRGALDSV